VEIDEVVHDARRSVMCGQVVGKITRMQAPERTLFSGLGPAGEIGGDSRQGRDGSEAGGGMDCI
jgi:hypothetical protein